MAKICGACKHFLKKGVINFCSDKCRKIGFIKKPVVRCNSCNKKIIKHPCEVNRTNFCNSRCKGNFMLGKSPWNKGKHTSNSGQFKHGKHHPLWNGGNRKTSFGYNKILKPDHPFADNMGYVLEHRFVMERNIGRYLRKEEAIHHINEIKDDNRIDNLMLFPTHGSHTAFHHKLRRDRKNYKNKNCH